MASSLARPRHDLLIQRDLELDAYGSIAAAIADTAFPLPDPQEPVVIIADRGKFYELNLIGAFIWENLGYHDSAEALGAAIANSFDVSVETAVQDVIAFVEHLSSLGLVRER